MRYVVLAIVTVLLVFSSLTAHAQNLLLNGDFHSLEDHWQISGPPRSFSDAFYAIGHGEPTVLAQNVSLAPGRYQLDLSAFYTLMYPGSGASITSFLPDSYEMAIVVDGISVSSWSTSQTTALPDTGWPPPWEQKTITWTGQVSSNVGVRFVCEAAQYEEYCPDLVTVMYPVGLNNISLTASAVPEPASILVLVTGVAGLASIRRRRKA